MKQSKKQSNVILLIICLIVIGTQIINFLNAKLLPAEKKGDSYFITRNVNVDYCIGTSANVRETAIAFAQLDVYKSRNKWLELELERLENKPDYSMYWFVGGILLGAYVAK